MGFEETDKTGHKAYRDGGDSVVGGSGQDGGDPASEADYGDFQIIDGDKGGGRSRCEGGKLGMDTQLDIIHVSLFSVCRYQYNLYLAHRSPPM